MVVVFVGSFYFRWAVGLLGFCVCWVCCFCWIFLLPLGCWAVGSVVFVGSVVLVGSFYFRWAVGLLGCFVCWVCCFCWIFFTSVGLLGCWVVGLLGLLCLLDPVVFVGSF